MMIDGLLTILRHLPYINSKNSRNARAAFFWTHISVANCIHNRLVFRDFANFTVSVQPF